jgi:hypothetical protein
VTRVPTEKSSVAEIPRELIEAYLPRHLQDARVVVVADAAG